jgi:hypothetical protein
MLSGALPIKPRFHHCSFSLILGILSQILSASDKYTKLWYQTMENTVIDNLTMWGHSILAHNVSPIILALYFFHLVVNRSKKCTHKFHNLKLSTASFQV